MQDATTGLINLEQAHQLVAMLSDGQQQLADDFIRELAQPLQKELFDEVGKLTRQLHNSLADFQLDSRLTALAHTDIPDAKERLNYVIQMTEQAANKTMDAVEIALPVADTLLTSLASVKPAWERLMRRDIDLAEFKSLCHDVQHFMQHTEENTLRLKELLNQVLMAQDFQDLTGQMIRRVIDLVREVENNLVSMLTVFGDLPETRDKSSQLSGIEAEGPIMNADVRQDAVAGQDEVDDLLSSLGF
ncbi:protein phosphatase CheZ [Shewanella sp. SNU WT4]|uniref:protein phosphatase CheZ n=1 Tax=Shewanella sp. SNU WT4 TaxID=2590015 RepID=UPI001126F922|nr:protein phosphatase CheZ [Shewanella sp. SNU WT4]QDF67668.1 protein phosphatase CheZ [Shewanella sp. SNU WT4]